MRKFLILFIIFMFTITNANAKYYGNQEGYHILNNLSYYDLLKLSMDKDNERLDFSVNNVLYTPIVDNSINPYSQYKFKKNDKIGEYIRVTSWNVARGFNIDDIKLLFSDEKKLVKKYGLKVPKKEKEIYKQADILKSTDIFVLNEVDIGMPRTKYKNIAREFAKTLGYNYAFATEFLEVDPVNLGREDYIWSEVRFLKESGKIKDYKVEKARYKGLHGNAIVSKYPIDNVRILRLPNYYDWYLKEKERSSELEKVKRKLAKSVFEEEMIREIRIGSRCALIADIKLPQFNKPITIIATHLENRTKPKNRAKQMAYLLQNIEHIENPVIIAGDFNTTNVDGSPTKVTKEISARLEDPHYLARMALLTTTPYGWGASVTRGLVEFFRNANDPVAKSIPVVAPNKEKKLFKHLAHFKFNDGYFFDFKGNKNESYNKKSQSLANSNERDEIGFVPTFEFQRDFKVVKYKLDWIFVKAYSKKSNDKKASVKLAPHFGRTLYDLNFSLNKKLSDHAPISVILPINDYKNNKL